MQPLSDDDIEGQLAGEAVRGPRAWRGRPLAKLSRGLRALRNKVVAPDDPAEFFDVAMLHILAEAHAETEDGRLKQRRALILGTDDITGFRARITILMDDCSDADIEEAKNLTNEILGLVNKAEVVLAEKKAESSDSAAPSPTTTPEPSSIHAESLKVPFPQTKPSGT